MGFKPDQQQAQKPEGAADDTPPVTPTDEPTDQPAPTDDTDGAQPSSDDTPDDAKETPSNDGGEGDQEEQPQGKPGDQQRQPSRAERRIQQLNDKVKQANQQPYQPGQQQQQSPQFPSYQEGQEVSPEQLQRDVVQTADAIASLRVNQQLAQRDAINNFERDTESIPTKFSELNPDSPDYTPELDEAIAQDFQDRAFRVVGYDNQGNPITQLDPSVRLADIAARHINSARAYAQKSSADMRNKVDASADTAAPRPSGAKPAPKKFEDLSLEEMKAKLGYHKV